MRHMLNGLGVVGAFFGILVVASQFSTPANAQPNGVPLALAQIQTLLTALQQSVNATQPRKFYLTQALGDAADAPTMCAAGYHMASMWEILDPTELRYDSQLGLVQADSGSGPPSDREGWVRTGNIANELNSGPGDSNCEAYTSNQAGHFGTFAELTEHWDTEVPEPVTPWSTGAGSCSFPTRVWCVQN